MREYWMNRNEERVTLVNKIKTKYETEIENSIKGTKIYDEPTETCTKQNRETEKILQKADSVSAVFEYAKPGKNTAVLNFANFLTPGGGFISGAMAQEEALCLESTLYPVISDDAFDPYYRQNKDMKPFLGSLYGDRALYTPDVVFFRDGKEVFCDVITCAAPNAHQYIVAGGNQKVNGITLMNRIKFILDIAVKEGVDTLILGAFGCGVFGHNPGTLGSIYKYLLDEYEGVFETVVIAVIDQPTLDRIHNGFVCA